MTQNKRHTVIASMYNRKLPVLLFLIPCTAAFLYIYCVHNFLSPIAPIDAPVVVIEGWLNDTELIRASDHIYSRNYKTIIVTGGPLERGWFLSEYKSFAEVAGATLERLTGRKDIVVVSSPPTRKDRTFASALALRAWIEENGLEITRFNLISSGVHTRRSWLLYKVALGQKYAIGAFAVPPQTYDADRWWAYSEGFKTVIAETIAYLYSVIVFPFTNESLRY